MVKQTRRGWAGVEFPGLYHTEYRKENGKTTKSEEEANAQPYSTSRDLSRLSAKLSVTVSTNGVG